MSETNVARHRNEVHLAGVLARDPIIKYTPSGKAVANLTITTKYQQYSEFHRVTAWEALAEKCAQLVKGDFVRVCGRLQTRSWDDAKTGQKKYITEIIAFQIALAEEEPVKAATAPAINGKAVAKAILSPPSKPVENIHGVAISDADIPF